jgi:hypothetical protein
MALAAVDAFGSTRAKGSGNDVRHVIQYHGLYIVPVDKLPNVSVTSIHTDDVAAAAPRHHPYRVARMMCLLWKHSWRNL